MQNFLINKKLSESSKISLIFNKFNFISSLNEAFHNILNNVFLLFNSYEFLMTSKVSPLREKLCRLALTCCEFFSFLFWICLPSRVAEHLRSLHVNSRSRIYSMVSFSLRSSFLMFQWWLWDKKLSCRQGWGIFFFSCVKFVSFIPFYFHGLSS